MRAGVIHRALGARPSKPLVVRGGLARTFGGLAGFVVVTFLCAGFYILQEAFANPISGAGSVAVISAAFIITLAGILLFFLIKPRKRPRTASRARFPGAATPAARPFLKEASGSVHQDHLRNNLSYQRFYVAHSRIRQ
jgi:hypothetical protein